MSARLAWTRRRPCCLGTSHVPPCLSPFHFLSTFFCCWRLSPARQCIILLASPLSDFPHNVQVETLGCCPAPWYCTVMIRPPSACCPLPSLAQDRRHQIGCPTHDAIHGREDREAKTRKGRRKEEWGQALGCHWQAALGPPARCFGYLIRGKVQPMEGVTQMASSKTGNTPDSGAGPNHIYLSPPYHSVRASHGDRFYRSLVTFLHGVQGGMLETRLSSAGCQTSICDTPLTHLLPSVVGKCRWPSPIEK